MPKLNPTPPVSARYGAPMGRHTHPCDLDPEAGRFYLRHIRLNSGGYDAGGAYWGHHQRLYYVEDGYGGSLFFRAWDREAAKAFLIAKFPGATFWR